MGVDVPDLDDRSYEGLLADARKRIPVHAPEWTDHNAHDPGITILELLAWVAETHTYQLDRVTDAHRRQYLDLVGVEPRPPQPATVSLELDVPWPDPAPSPAELSAPADLDDLDGRSVPADAEVVAETTGGRQEAFRTDDDLVLSMARVRAVVVSTDGDRTEHTTANDSAGMYFPAVGTDPAAGDALYLGFDANPFAHPTLDLWLDYHDADLPAVGTHGDEAVDFEPSLRCLWEHCLEPGDWYEPDAWEPVPVERDETRALYRGGRVRLARPEGWRDAPARVADHDEALYWVRCRLAPVEPEPVPGNPGYERPRVCESPESDPAEFPEPAEPPEPRYEVPPRLNHVSVNVVRATHRESCEAAALRRPDGRDTTSAAPDQTFELGRSPVRSADVAVGGDPWEEVDDFAASGPDDRHYVLDRAAGTVTFGDGRQGTIPPVREPVSAGFIAGGGPAGNLPADADWALPPAGLDRLAVNPLPPPSGGTGAESVDAALARARAQRRRTHRAVSAEDFATLARQTPGLRIARADLARPPGDGEPGRVVVVPYSPEGRLPVPSAGVLEAVERHLCRHTLLTERVETVAPTFVDLAVTVEIDPESSADPARAIGDVQERVRSFLAPLSGFEGNGWPFGRPVYRSELYEQIETVETVADAIDVGVRTHSEVGMDDSEDTLQNLAALSVDVHDEGERCGRGPR